jgi:hypothetical protein
MDVRPERSRPTTGLVVPLVAAGGVLMGHWLTYLFLTPDGRARGAELARTGHGYWTLAVPVSIWLAVAALVVVGGRAIRARRAGARSQAYLATFGRLAAAQAVAFLVLEVAERLGVHQSLDPLLHTALLPLGVVIQVAVAAAGALVLVGFAGAAVRILSAIRARLAWRRARPVSSPRPAAVLRLPGATRFGVALVRAPPTR